MIHSGLVSVTFRGLSPAAVVDLAVRGGLEGIEWGGDVHVPHGDIQRAHQVSRITAEAGLTAVSYGSYYEVAESEHTGLPFEKVLETAITLEAPIIRVWAGNRGSADTDARYRDRVVRESRRIADLASAAGIALSFEFHETTLADTSLSALRLLEDIAHEGVRTYWQPPNERSVEYCLAGLKEMLPWLSHVHVFHWHPTPDTRHPLSEGSHVWERYLKSIASTGREHFALLEFVKDDNPEVFVRDAETLKAWLSRL